MNRRLIMTTIILMISNIFSTMLHTVPYELRSANFNQSAYFYGYFYYSENYNSFRDTQIANSNQFIQNNNDKRNLYFVKFHTNSEWFLISSHSLTPKFYFALLISHIKQVSDSKLILCEETKSFLFNPIENKTDYLITRQNKIIPVLKCFDMNTFAEKYKKFLHKQERYLNFPYYHSYKDVVDIIFTHFEDNVYDILMFSIFYIFVSNGFNNTFDPIKKEIFFEYYNEAFNILKEKDNLFFLIKNWKENRIYYQSMYEAYIFLIERFYFYYFDRFACDSDFQDVLYAFKWCVYNSLCIFFN